MIHRDSIHYILHSAGVGGYKSWTMNRAEQYEWHPISADCFQCRLVPLPTEVWQVSGDPTRPLHESEWEIRRDILKIIHQETEILRYIKGKPRYFFFNINVCVCSWTETELVTVECIVCRNICIINVSTPWLLSNTLSRLREMFSLMKSELFLHILRAERVLIVKHNWRTERVLGARTGSLSAGQEALITHLDWSV